MRISILPKAPSGWWSVGLVVASLVLGFASEDIISPAGVPNYPTALRVSLSFAYAIIAGVGSVIGLFSIIKRKQGAILVFVSTALGLLILILGVISAVQIAMGTS